MDAERALPLISAGNYRGVWERPELLKILHLLVSCDSSECQSLRYLSIPGWTPRETTPTHFASARLALSNGQCCAPPHEHEFSSGMTVAIAPVWRTKGKHVDFFQPSKSPQFCYKDGNERISDFPRVHRNSIAPCLL